MTKIQFAGLFAVVKLFAPSAGYSAECRLENIREIQAKGISAWHPVWTPDGDSILFANFEDSGKLPIYIGNIHAAKSKFLANSVEIPYDGYGFSPDGSKVTVDKIDWIKEGRGKKRRVTASVLDIRTGAIEAPTKTSESWEPVRFQKDREARTSIPTYKTTKDGLKAFFVRNGSFYLRNQNGIDKKVAVAIPGRILSMDWIPDDGALVACVETERSGEPEADVTAADLFIINPEKKSVTRLTKTSEVVEYDPQISPDGKRIAFLDLQSEGLSRLMVGDLKCDVVMTPSRVEKI
jgi:Tol biopolymer transport system component